MKRADNIEIVVHDLNNNRHVFNLPDNAQRKVREHFIEYTYTLGDERKRLVLSLFGLPYMETSERNG